MSNPYEILIGTRHLANAGKTPVSQESYNKLQEAIEGLLWAIRHEQYDSPRYAGDPDPDFTTVDGTGVDHSGHDIDEGILKSIVGRDFYVGRPASGNDITPQVREFCKMNRPTNTTPNDKDFGLNFRYVYGHNTFAVEDNATLGKVINSGMVFDGVNFTDVGETWSRLDIRGLSTTNATVTITGGVGFITFPAGVNFYNEHINPGDFVFLPNDTTWKMVRVTRVVSPLQIEVDQPPGTTGTGITVRVLRGPIIFRRCRFENTVYVNNTYGILFHDCEFVYDEDNSQYGGILASAYRFPTDDPGEHFHLRCVNCRFIQRSADITIGSRPSPAPVTNYSMIVMDNAWHPLFLGNHWHRVGVPGVGGGFWMTNGASNSTKQGGQGGVAAGNQMYNLGSGFTQNGIKQFIAGVCYLYSNLNVADAWLI